MTGMLTLVGSALLVCAAYAANPVLGLAAAGAWLVWIARRLEGNSK